MKTKNQFQQTVSYLSLQTLDPFAKSQTFNLKVLSLKIYNMKGKNNKVISLMQSQGLYQVSRVLINACELTSFRKFPFKMLGSFYPLCAKDNRGHEEEKSLFKQLLFQLSAFR